MPGSAGALPEEPNARWNPGLRTAFGSYLACSSATRFSSSCSFTLASFSCDASESRSTLTRPSSARRAAAASGLPSSAAGAVSGLAAAVSLLMCLARPPPHTGCPGHRAHTNRHTHTPRRETPAGYAVVAEQWRALRLAASVRPEWGTFWGLLAQCAGLCLGYPTAAVPPPVLEVLHAVCFRPSCFRPVSAGKFGGGCQSGCVPVLRIPESWSCEKVTRGGGAAAAGRAGPRARASLQLHGTQP
eukprot:COSAG01_NODE_12274_length_1768_cov_818.260036_2_plen_244_part_00